MTDTRFRKFDLLKTGNCLGLAAQELKSYEFEELLNDFSLLTKTEQDRLVADTILSDKIPEANLVNLLLSLIKLLSPPKELMPKVKIPEAKEPSLKEILLNPDVDKHAEIDKIILIKFANLCLTAPNKLQMFLFFLEVFKCAGLKSNDLGLFALETLDIIIDKPGLSRAFSQHDLIKLLIEMNAIIKLEVKDSKMLQENRENRFFHLGAILVQKGFFLTGTTLFLDKQPMALDKAKQLFKDILARDEIKPVQTTMPVKKR